MQTDIAHHKSATLNSWFYNLQIPVYHAIYHLGFKKNADKLSLTKKIFCLKLNHKQQRYFAQCLCIHEKKIIFKHDITNLNLCI